MKQSDDTESRKVAVITGGEGVLAQAMAAELEGGGWQVLSPPRQELDVACPETVARFFGSLFRLDLLVCAAGVTRDSLAVTQSTTDWADVLEVNLHGAARCARAAARLMAARGDGHIVFISSHSALTGNPGQAAYATSKSALAGLTASLARELGPRGIRVNCLLPGFFDSKLTAALTPKARQHLIESHVLGRLACPQDAARFLACLDSLRAVSGQTFRLDSRIARWS